MKERTPAFWDLEAAAFDRAPDHGLSDPAVRTAWTQLLEDLLPAAPAAVADFGCGTGSLAVLLAEMGHSVCGFDFAPAMVEQARAKARQHRVDVKFTVADVAKPPVASRSLDVVVARHVAWALSDPADAVGRWAEALTMNGRLVLVEGCWSTGAGLPSVVLVEMLERNQLIVEARSLKDPALWGHPISDERYVLVARSRVR